MAAKQRPAFEDDEASIMRKRALAEDAAKRRRRKQLSERATGVEAEDDYTEAITGGSQYGGRK